MVECVIGCKIFEVVEVDLGPIWLDKDVMLPSESKEEHYEVSTHELVFEDFHYEDRLQNHTRLVQIQRKYSLLHLFDVQNSALMERVMNIDT